MTQPPKNVTAIKVSSSIDEAANELLNQSFCIFQVDEAVKEKIFRSRSEALRLLDQSTLFESLCCSCHRILNGNLHGFNVPSTAKRLFRAFPSSDLQPWPNTSFRSSSQDLASSLHAILIALLKRLIQKAQVGGICDSQSKPAAIHSDRGNRFRKRKREFDEPPNVQEAAASESRANGAWTIPETSAQTTKCPLDFFLYHNDDPHGVNCSEHIDRGALICVCLSSASPGLEVQPRNKALQGKHDFICPEESLIYNKSLHTEKSAVSGLICIMAGDQLGPLLGQERIACVHRVRNGLSRARLSISYELRL